MNIQFRKLPSLSNNCPNRHFDVLIDTTVIGTFEWIMQLCRGGTHDVARVYSRHGGMPAIVKTEKQAADWLMRKECEWSESQSS